MRASLVGIVGDEAIATLHRRKLGNHLLHRRTHRTQVNGDVRSVCNQFPSAIEDSATKVSSLFDVDADSCLLQHGPHLLRNRRHTLREDFSQHRVDVVLFGCLHNSAVVHNT